MFEWEKYDQMIENNHEILCRHLRKLAGKDPNGEKCEDKKCPGCPFFIEDER